MVSPDLSEADVCDQFITPAIQNAGWDKLLQIRREYTFTAGRVQVRGKVAARGLKKRADYVLFYQRGLPLAVVEAKDGTVSPGHGMEQAIAYAKALDIPFAFSSNGEAFVMHDLTGAAEEVETHVPMGAFPSPESLFERYKTWRGLKTEAATTLARFPYHDDGSGKEPRYYQRIAIQRTVESVARGEDRILLVMATGTGKTYTAFQIIWRLWKSRKVERVLFLVDRNILADQAKNDDFAPLGEAMTKITKRTINKSYEIYLCLYQAVTGTEAQANIYKEFSPGFFDLIVIDECHRGSAREESAWRAILDYFDSAIHLGLTATPKETKSVSTHTYFGDPIYEYSLKRGIDDGFLAPFKVVRVDLDKDLQGWRPTKGMRDELGQEIEDRIYNQKDMDRTLVLRERTKLVAAKVLDYLLATDPYGKTIVFCEDIDHAARMRSALINGIHKKYPKEAGMVERCVSRMTGDSKEGRANLDDFMHPEKRYPFIATTSKLLTTGVNVKTLKLVVLDQRIGSMIEFKQIVGRGTRIHEEGQKLWFTIMDFKKATELFADPDWDGPPIVIYVPEPDDPIAPPDGSDDAENGDDGVIVDPPLPPGDGVKKYVVPKVKVSILAERTQYLGADGKLITESLKNYTRATINQQYKSLDDFIQRWGDADKKLAIVEELREHGVLFEALQDLVEGELDPFDLICHVAFDQPPLTRRERAEDVKKRDVFTRYGEEARTVLDALLDKYADEGLGALEDGTVLKLPPFNQMGTPMELARRFGGTKTYRQAIRSLGKALYIGGGAGSSGIRG